MVTSKPNPCGTRSRDAVARLGRLIGPETAAAQGDGVGLNSSSRRLSASPKKGASDETVRRQLPRSRHRVEVRDSIGNPKPRRFRIRLFHRGRPHSVTAAGQRQGTRLATTDSARRTHLAKRASNRMPGFERNRKSTGIIRRFLLPKNPDRNLGRPLTQSNRRGGLFG